MQNLPKHMVAYASAPPALIVDLPLVQASRALEEEWSISCQKPAMAIVLYKLVEDQKVQMTQHKIVKWTDSQLLSKDWQSEINISESYLEQCKNFMKILTQFLSIFNGYLGKISIFKHSNDLVPNSNHVHSTPYRAGSTVPKFHRLEI